jgi:regulator of protease activity HflC (stomatin/prohibitin superfamily)
MAFLIILMVLFGVIALSCVRICKVHEKAVIFRFGRFLSVKEPGLFFVLKGIDKEVRVDTRSTVLDIPKLNLSTSDGVKATANLTVTYRISNAEKAVIVIKNIAAGITDAVSQVLATAAQEVPIDTIVKDSTLFCSGIKQPLNKDTDSFGITIEHIDIKQVSIET